MTLLALGLFLLYLVVAFALRTLVQLHRTGDSGFRGVSGRPGSPRWWAGVLFGAAIVAGAAGPVTGLLGLDPIVLLDQPWVAATGTVVMVAGIAATVHTQFAMGASWRIGVDPTETTALVTTGPFGVVRNPIFTAMAVTGTGFALMVPNAVALTGVAVLLLALHLQVRVVEEPYLQSVHGSAYEEYARRTGRFVPGLGRLPEPGPRTARRRRPSPEHAGGARPAR